QRIVIRRSERDESDPTRVLREELGADEWIGRSSELAEILAGIARVAKSDEAVLLTGPSGVGKSLAAGLIHRNSKRQDAPFVSVSCGEGKPARGLLLEKSFAAAVGGVLFVEEVGDLPEEAQVRLLELLNGQSVDLGEGQKSRSVDLRWLVSSSADLRELVRHGVLRGDLCAYLEKQRRLDLPALSERVDDISMLAEHFCRQICNSNRLPQLRLSFAALRALEDHEWTGHLDELQSMLLQGALAASRQGIHMIERRHLFPDVREGLSGRTWSERNFVFQRSLLNEMLRECDWNVAKTARVLDLARSGLYEKIRKFGISRE
ncbi:MAG TPA: sigma-54-dependent Fis family transcriptional regulator, partial [Nannocystis exedens]|nr:sigma-54-dependent Fis family transcriptional regulator [Nannocystis exedens]